MATFEIAENKMITCPYDVTHRMKESKYQAHVAKCQLKHLDIPIDTCPFNAQHRVNPGLMTHHILSCSDRGPVDKLLVANAQNNTFKGHTGVPSYSCPPIESNENWDAELDPSAAPGYEPRVEPPNGGIRINFDGMLPSQRKSYYQNLPPTVGGDAELEVERRRENLPELRSPRSVSYVQVLDQQSKPVQELQNVGLGRGQPTGSTSGSSRIAANIFGDQAQSLRQPRSSPNMPGFTPNYVGTGRGIVNGAIGKRVGASPVSGVDVDHIGLGRSARR